MRQLIDSIPKTPAADSSMTRQEAEDILTTSDIARVARLLATGISINNVLKIKIGV